MSNVYPFDDARSARDAALERVDEAADPEWKERAFEAVCTTAHVRMEFISDDVWSVGGLDSTREDRALGPVFLRAMREGICRKTDRVRPSVRSHLSGKPVWVSLVYEGALAPVTARPLKVLDLFAGLGGWSAAFHDRGHDVCTTDVDPRFKVTVLKDILELRREDLPWTDVDVVLASPPCEGWSVMNIGRNWGRGRDAEGVSEEEWHRPKTETARMALALVRRTRQIVDALQPRWFIIENPRAKLRKHPVVGDLERRTVWYCHMGETQAKPTDLFGVFPPGLDLNGECHNQRAGHPEDCCCRDHTSAPRGSRTPGSTQGVTGPNADALRAEVPYRLSKAVCLATERALEATG